MKKRLVFCEKTSSLMNTKATRFIYFRIARRASVVDRTSNDVKQFIGDGLLTTLVVLQIQFTQ